MTDFLRLMSGAPDRRGLPTLSRLSEDDVHSIWAQVSAYIDRQMTSHKGVHLAGLGTFTFSLQKLDLGTRLTEIRRPVFLLSGKLVQSLGLKQNRPLAAATHLPVVQLNFAAVAQESPFSRDVVEGCVRETLLILVRALASNQHVSVTFQGVGVLFFKNNKVRMKFNSDFMNAVDGSGRLLLALRNRPGSSVSLLSGGLSRTQRPESIRDITLPTVCSPQLDHRAADREGRRLSSAPEEITAGAKSHQPLQPAKMTAVSLLEELSPNPPMKATDKPDTSISKVEEPQMNVSCSGHARAGQELCYLCMQRAQRNVPVCLREQQQAEEEAQEKVLLLQDKQREQQSMEQEQVKLNEQREHAKQVATFNLQMSEKKEKTTCPLFPTSFIFQTRPLTPVKRIQQHRYMNDLQNQIETRRQREAQEQNNRLLMEQLDQVQLVQEIALKKAQQLQQKQERTQHYKMALDAQVGDKKLTETPQCQTDDCWFNRYETAVSDAEDRERAHKLFQENFTTAAQRKKTELHRRQAQLEREREMLKFNKADLILDSVHHFEKKRDVSKSLEDEWSRGVKLKHQREEEERRLLRSAGQLLVDKLTQYKRCHQCKRRTSNCGESNIWKDSHHLSGSQFMT